MGLAAIGVIVALVVAGILTQHIKRGRPQPAPTSTAAIAKAPCFGAASRDWQAPCSNPALRLDVVPTPEVAPTLRSTACPPAPLTVRLPICVFGVPASRASATVALVGDSHASDWLVAVDAVARAKRWHGYSLTHTSCPLSTAVRDLPNATRFVSCARWKRAVFAWFTHHPEVSTVFVAGLSGGSSVLPRDGMGKFETAVAGYIGAWDALPRTVRHIVVIRDTPKVFGATRTCIERALSEQQPPDPGCDEPRSQVLDADPLMVAAARMHSPRVQTIDLAHVFCDRRQCLPVIGGALVLKDATHMTATFAQTMAPLLLRQVDHLMASWR